MTTRILNRRMSGNTQGVDSSGQRPSSNSARREGEGRSNTSMRTDTTWRYSVFGPGRLGKGAMLFTGPDGIRDHRVHVDGEHRYVGEGSLLPGTEGTSETDYLWRAARGTPYPRPKSRSVGEIGWGIPTFIDWSGPNSGMQIALGEFRQATEDRHTHLYQNAWYPGPKDEWPDNSENALVMNVYNCPRRPYTGQNRRHYGYGTDSGSPANRRGSAISTNSYNMHEAY